MKPNSVMTNNVHAWLPRYTGKTLNFEGRLAM